VSSTLLPFRPCRNPSPTPTCRESGGTSVSWKTQRAEPSRPNLHSTSSEPNIVRLWSLARADQRWVASVTTSWPYADRLTCSPVAGLRDGGTTWVQLLINSLGPREWSSPQQLCMIDFGFFRISFFSPSTNSTQLESTAAFILYPSDPLILHSSGRIFPLPTVQ